MEQGDKCMMSHVMSVSNQSINQSLKKNTAVLESYYNSITLVTLPDGVVLPALSLATVAAQSLSVE